MWRHPALPSASVLAAVKKLVGAWAEGDDKEIREPARIGAVVLFGILARFLPAWRWALLACSYSEGEKASYMLDQGRKLILAHPTVHGLGKMVSPRIVRVVF